MKSDVKATQKTGDGLVFAGRTRLRGIVLGAPNATTAGVAVCLNGTGGSTYFLQKLQLEMFLHLIFQKMESYLKTEFS